MPHLDGRGFYRQLVDQDATARHNVIFVTGDILAPRTLDFLQKCGLPYLEKPFLVDELKKVVSLRLQKTANSTAHPRLGIERKAVRNQENVQRNSWKDYEA
jgi:DNA-binding response OmpR family regulator